MRRGAVCPDIFLCRQDAGTQVGQLDGALVKRFDGVSGAQWDCFPGFRLSDADYVKNCKQRDEKCGDQAEGKNGHGNHRWTLGSEQGRGDSEAYGQDEIGNSEKLPKNETAAMTGSGEFPGDKCGGNADGHVAVACR